MPAIKLTYFDLRIRAEAPRLALYIGGIPFVDERLSREEFQSRKAAGSLPFGQVPILTVDDQVLSQSVAILQYCGRVSKLYPTDEWKAAKVDEVLCALEEMMGPLAPTYHMEDTDMKVKFRKYLVDNVWPRCLRALENLLEKNGTGYFVGDSLTIADLQLYAFQDWITSGLLDYIPTDVFTAYPLLSALVQQVQSHPKVAEWNVAHRKQ
eukprot:comp21667_c0_seq1/m.30480 comp21667_c0_seq1/g.30480  ORF comp21667_c0_seq1/g.30480 comp21667_c0_seq1/m.30480 type:complete len:209 (-) comp21667_c0_seq1:640-1266(-)